MTLSSHVLRKLYPLDDFLVPVAILADYYGVKPVLSTCIALIADNVGIPKLEKLRVAIKTNATELEVEAFETSRLVPWYGGNPQSHGNVAG